MLNPLKRLINQIRNNLFPRDEEYEKTINYIAIAFDDKIPNARNIQFCPVYNRFLNPSKKINWKNI
jgi:hypothetical protein